MALNPSNDKPRSLTDRSTVEELSKGCTDDVGHLRVALIVSAVERTPKGAAEGGSVDATKAVSTLVNDYIGTLRKTFDRKSLKDNSDEGVLELATAAQADRKNIEAAFGKLDVLARKQAAAITKELDKISEVEKKRVELDSRLHEYSAELQRATHSDAGLLEKLHKTAEEQIVRLHAKAVPPAQAQNLCKMLDLKESEAKKRLEDAKERKRQFDAVVQTHGDNFMNLVKSINRMKFEEEALDDLLSTTSSR